ncbi:25614_t:CDS:2 [Gigaspora margarita]|uniref:25614_t:CDS:1 n=1 Tax=Gigaspora margarita TaxID=4874 RepID=A0ABM8W3S3_GIGMA|nr:25614_t:CDS:2 [Gigaspora margarita]
MSRLMTPEQSETTFSNASAKWSDEVDLEFSVSKDPTDTCSSNSDDLENSPGSMKKLSRKIAKNPNIIIMDIQNNNLNQNMEVAEDKEVGSSEQAMNEAIAEDQHGEEEQKT